jgi:predicted RNA binding protein YcfA (HicA-like mRNA interferase family)
MRYREVEKKLRALGCVELPRAGDGSHRKWLNPQTGRATIVPDWGGDDL